MRLELRKINIKDIVFANDTKVNDNILYLNKEEIRERLIKLANKKTEPQSQSILSASI